MSTPSLPLNDYRALFSVLDDVANSPYDGFFDTVREAFACHLGWADTVIVDIPADANPFPSHSVALDHMYSNRPTTFLEEYIDRWYLRNPFKTPQANAMLRREGLLTLGNLRLHSTSEEWKFVDEYLHRHSIGDVLNGISGATLDGFTLFCVYFSDESALQSRERALMKYLNRHLEPWLRQYFMQRREKRSKAVLTRREEEIARLIALGLTNTEIAARLHITIETVKKHLTHAMAKMKCTNRTQLALLVSGLDPA